ncbi:hypothetical protein EXIGLDRAFT_768445 [Exidia glandulosa HHB12029]|uniref:DRBM domain-containing protein n=1 Tax=Exidia glandulosa HHB12029 TaxID=1314781 RepID=A0A165I7E5_EXIGL|nr:hypothetical protein EXIGLDRAFT_768445 [Exidia glandulosa HHB12029]
MDWQDSMVGSPHNPTWTSVLIINGAEFTSGKGRNKKASRTSAAIHALAQLALLPGAPQQSTTG